MSIKKELKERKKGPRMDANRKREWTRIKTKKNLTQREEEEGER